MNCRFFAESEGTVLSHQQVNTQIGAPGDTVMTDPLVNFLSGCFKG